MDFWKKTFSSSKNKTKDAKGKGGLETDDKITTQEATLEDKPREEDEHLVLLKNKIIAIRDLIMSHLQAQEENSTGTSKEEQPKPEENHVKDHDKQDGEIHKIKEQLRSGFTDIENSLQSLYEHQALRRKMEDSTGQFDIHKILDENANLKKDLLVSKEKESKLEEMIKELEDEFDIVKDQNALMKAEYANSITMVTDTKAENEKLKGIMADIENCTNTQRDQITALKSELESTNGLRNRIDEERKMWHQTLEETKKQLADLQKSSSTTEQKLKARVTEVENIVIQERLKFDNRNKEYAKLEELSTETRDSLNGMIEDNRKLNQELESLKDNMKATKQKYKDQKKKAKKMCQDLVDMHNQANNNIQQKSDNDEEVNSLQMMIEDLISLKLRDDSLTKEQKMLISRHKNDMMELQDKFEQANAQVNELRMENEELRSNKGELSKMVNTLTEKRTNAMNEIDRLKRELSSCRSLSGSHGKIQECLSACSKPSYERLSSHVDLYRPQEKLASARPSHLEVPKLSLTGREVPSPTQPVQRQVMTPVKLMDVQPSPLTRAPGSHTTTHQNATKVARTAAEVKGKAVTFLGFLRKELEAMYKTYLLIYVLVCEQENEINQLSLKLGIFPVKKPENMEMLVKFEKKMNDSVSKSQEYLDYITNY